MSYLVELFFTPTRTRRGEKSHILIRCYVFLPVGGRESNPPASYRLRPADAGIEPASACPAPHASTLLLRTPGLYGLPPRLVVCRELGSLFLRGRLVVAVERDSRADGSPVLPVEIHDDDGRRVHVQCSAFGFLTPCNNIL